MFEDWSFTTGRPALDECLKGGFRKGSLVLVRGPARETAEFCRKVFQSQPGPKYLCSEVETGGPSHKVVLKNGENHYFPSNHWPITETVLESDKVYAAQTQSVVVRATSDVFESSAPNVVIEIQDGSVRVIRPVID